MKNTTEYHALLERLDRGETLSSQELQRLEQYIAEDPASSGMMESLRKVDQSVLHNRATLLKSADHHALRSTVSALSRSVPAGTATAGGGVLFKVLGSLLVTALAGVGLWFVVESSGGDNGDPGIQPIEAQQMVIEDSVGQLPATLEPAPDPVDVARKEVDRPTVEMERRVSQPALKGTQQEADDVSGLSGTIDQDEVKATETNAETSAKKYQTREDDSIPVTLKFGSPNSDKEENK